MKDTDPSTCASWNQSLVVTGQRVDRTEGQLAALDPRLTAKKLRRFSYGNVFYKHVRSGYAPEYHTTASASPFPQISEPAPISYVNVLRRSDRKTQRRIHFGVAWVAEVVESVCTSVVALGLEKAVPDSKAWWVDG